MAMSAEPLPINRPLHSVRYSHQRLIGPNEWRRVTGELLLH
ncbi:hypothetical protein HFO32_18345 [Rhizobium leguminosarum]|nr:hypothetical protein [Rhizobium laguerreae]MBY5545672.1 hypothetical protein [Rhizobium leguminosarum]MBY5583431.1 hypothetical protein [Rhizobium leguminosarum]MBY5588807.1 hypothetical protein [Rhizobium leguminosarum]MBY5603082.1 hypothetical protein [Rhizobium leguminosarum]